MYTSIALPLPINTPFIYLIPAEFNNSAEIGRRAVVPFGRRVLTGFLIDITDNPGDVPPAKLKSIIDVIDDEPVFDSHMLELAAWVADYYLSSVGDVLKTAMPHGTMIKSRVRVHAALSAEKTDVSISKQQQEVLETICKKGNILLRKLERSTDYKVAGIVHSLEKKGFIRLEREINAPSVRPKTERYVIPSTNPPETFPTRAKQQARCREVLKKHTGGIVLGELLERYSFSRGVVNAVVDAGWAHYEDVEVTRRIKMLEQESIDADHPFTAEQGSCFRTIMKEFASKKPRPVLLRGVTGSGKTRVYIEIVREMLKKGKGAIILVPEISLTPQTTRFFSSVFPGKVAVLHSAMSAGERYDMWHLIHNGDCQVVIGPRSAIFAPIKNPGVIIVDEEHDTSYKQTDNAPRYNARDVAVVRGNILGIPVILGSATPSIESWHNASTGKYLLGTLSRRVHSRPLPDVIMIDMKKERIEGNLSSLSRCLRDELAERIESGEKSIILINRRGFATGVQCPECGNALTCPQCAVGLIYHSSKKLAVCHLCGHEQLVLEHCPNCGSDNLRYKGIGTQRIEKELETIVNPDSIVRMDYDTTRTHDAHFRLLEEFRKGSASILLGTQMVAKGLDFPEVTLVGIISADLSLYIPDFRASERTFQLITQVAGRAGRGKTPGKVILQTFNPDNYAVTTASKQDFETFAEKELELRHQVGFPPFSRLVLIELSSEKLQSLKNTAGTIAVYLKTFASRSTEIMGPVEAPIPRVKGKHRIHILVKTDSTASIRSLIRHIIDNLPKGRENVDVDVDPVDFM